MNRAQAVRSGRVGFLVLAAAVVFALGVFFIGEQNNLFSRKTSYYVDLPSVSGIKPGNPIEIDGVAVGAVSEVILPRDPARKLIRVWMKVDQHYSGRVRGDSRVRIKTLGLLGDKFLALNSGTPAFPEIPDKGAVAAAPATDVDSLIASSGNVMDNVSTISYQLKTILDRLERGEGLLGELLTDSPSSRQLKEKVLSTLDSLDRAAKKLDSGDGPLPRLLNDRALGDRLVESVGSLHSVLAAAEHGPGLLPGLLNDPATRDDYDHTLASLRQVADDLKKFSARLEQGDGLLPKLLNDKEYGQQVSNELRQLVHRLNETAESLDHGDGTAAKLIHDPQIYDSINDVLVGVHDSWMLRWLIRNRQKAGIKHRFKDAKKAVSAPAPVMPEDAMPRADSTMAPTPVPPPPESSPSPPPFRGRSFR